MGVRGDDGYTHNLIHADLAVRGGAVVVLIVAEGPVIEDAPAAAELCDIKVTRRGNNVTSATLGYKVTMYIPVIRHQRDATGAGLSNNPDVFIRCGYTCHT